MTDQNANQRVAVPAGAAALVCLMFFVSGSVGLIYQVAWKHFFTTVFGSTTYAVSVVISVFMAGLALGSHVFGRLADRTRRHLLVYALLQAGIAASGFAVPWALRWSEHVYAIAYRSTGSPAALLAAQVAMAALVLLVPTFLMGGTLPVLSRLMAEREGGVARAVGLLYGLNTLGAAVGAFLTGFVLVKAFGTLKTIHLAALANLALAVCAAALSRSALRAGSPEDAAGDDAREEGAVLDPWRTRLLLAAVAVSGFVAFSYEVLWTRLLAFKLQTTVQAFSIMLSALLLGLGLGSAALALARRRRPKADWWRLYGFLEAAVGITGMATILLFFSARRGYPGFVERTIGEFAFSATVMLVPTTLMGAAFPIACHLLASDVGRTGRSVGRIYVFNTAGAVAGAVATGFFLVRALGTQASLTVASLLIVASGTAVLVMAPAVSGRRPGGLPIGRPIAIAAVWLAALAVWYVTPSDFLARYFLKNQFIVLNNPDSPARLVGAEEGVEGVVVVCEVEGSGRTISTGSTDVAGTHLTLRTTQKLQAHIPMLLHPNPRDVCQVGFGSGETAHLFSTYDVDRFDCVEISRAVLRSAGKHFADINGGIVGDPAFRPIVMDAAAYLKYTTRTYDVIANDATWPNLAGPAMLYTQEYFRNGLERLKPGGVMTSWLPLEMPEQDFRSVLRTFRSVFPHVYVWSTLTHFNKHALIVGSRSPLELDAGRFLERFDRFAREDLASVFLGDPTGFLVSHLAEVKGDDPELAAAPLNTADLPTLQFLHTRAGGYALDERRGMVAASLEFLSRRRDLISRRLVCATPTARTALLLARLQPMDEATTHLLAARMLRYAAPLEAQAEYRKARELTPSHPAFLAEPGAR